MMELQAMVNSNFMLVLFEAPMNKPMSKEGKKESVHCGWANLLGVAVDGATLNCMSRYSGPPSFLVRLSFTSIAKLSSCWFIFHYYYLKHNCHQLNVLGNSLSQSFFKFVIVCFNVVASLVCCMVVYNSLLTTFHASFTTI